MRIGSAKIDITPPLNIPHLAYLPRQGKFKGIHDSLYARAIIFDNGETRAALVSADSIGFHKELPGKGRDFTNEIRNRIQQRTGINGTNVMLATTHAHSAPETTGITRLLDAEGAAAWIEVLMDQISSAVEIAQSDMIEMSLKAATGEARGIAKNRRKHDMTIEEQRKMGLVDDSVGVLLCESEDRTIFDVLINFSCHPVTVQVQAMVSADYPGVATKLVESAYNGCRSCLFLQGAAGNINPMRDDTRDFRDVELYGMILGGETIKLVARLRAPNAPVMDEKLGIMSRMLMLPSRDLPDPAPFREAYQKALKDAEHDEKALRTAGYNRETLDRIERGTDPIPAEIQVLRVGDLAIVGIPGEMFVELGFQIRHNSAASYTFVSETTNDWIGYIVSPGTYQEGGYEIHPGPWSMTNEEGGRMIVNTAISLIDELWAG